MIEGAEHAIWFSRHNELRSLLRYFVDDIIVKEDGELRWITKK
jgi:hypothetical protein